MASAARPSIVEVRGDGLPRYACNDGRREIDITSIEKLEQTHV